MNQRHHLSVALLVLLFGLAAPPAIAAAEKPAPPDSTQPTMPVIPLMDLLDAVAARTNMTFLVDRRVDSTVVNGGLSPKDADYSLLLGVLANNGLAAVSTGKAISIIPARSVRQFAIPVLDGDSGAYEDEEWVTRIVTLENAKAARTIPILRPLVPQAGHLTAFPDANAILICDRYANVQRIVKLLQTLDAASVKSQ